MSDAWKAWERAIAAEARKHGLPWERRLRTGDNNDMLDIDGPFPDGWLIGGKAVSRRGNLADRMSGAMEQNERAVANAEERYPGRSGDVIPFQVVQRQGYVVARAYAVTEFHYLLRLVLMRREWDRMVSR